MVWADLFSLPLSLLLRRELNTECMESMKGTYIYICICICMPEIVDRKDVSKANERIY